MNKIQHSLADWDYRAGAALQISTARYISPPSSVRCAKSTTMNNREWLFLKSAVDNCITRGYIEQWWQFGETGYSDTYLFFRAQAIPTNAEPADCYRVVLTKNSWIIGGRLATVEFTLTSGTISPVLVINTWYKLRVKWWVIITANFVTALRIKLELYRAGAWVTLKEYDDNNNRWYTSAVNKVGFALTSYYATYCQYADDTEIWKAIT